MTRRAKDAATEQLLKSLSPPHHFNWQHFLYHVRVTSNTAYTDWHDFITSPVFPSSLAISLLFFTVLSFDGVLLSYLLTHNWSNAFLSGMRGLSVIAGLAGTVVMPMAEKRIGLIRTGSWSIISQLICLAPVTLSFFINPAPVGEQGAVWNAVVLFSFLSL
jgi:iron-regulated transporter 1